MEALYDYARSTRQEGPLLSNDERDQFEQLTKAVRESDFPTKINSQGSSNSNLAKLVETWKMETKETTENHSALSFHASWHLVVIGNLRSRRYLELKSRFLAGHLG